MTENATALPLKELEDGLRLWASTSDSPVAAAVELLIEHGTWTRRRDFLDAAAHYYPDENMVTIRWWEAAEAVPELRGSSSELAVLSTAIGLARDEFGWNGLGKANRASVLKAITTALEGAR